MLLVVLLTQLGPGPCGKPEAVPTRKGAAGATTNTNNYATTTTTTTTPTPTPTPTPTTTTTTTTTSNNINNNNENTIQACQSLEAIPTKKGMPG